MWYIINSTVKYNSADGTLLCPDSSIDMITLTRMTSELLVLLINNRNTPLSRDVILRELWEKRGLSASSNNLNNYVSMLRKALNQCGCPNVIVTIPKHGFLFEADIVVMAEGNNKQLVPWSSWLKPTLDVQKNNQVAWYFSIFKRFNMTFIVGGFLLLFFFNAINGHFRLQSVRSELYRLEQCRVYVMDDKTRALDSDSTIKTVKMIINNEKLSCKRKANIYYFADKRLDALKQVIIDDLLSYCLYESNAPCDNYVLSRYENEI
ncbi:TPA: transcriptional regulator [Serratia fonticola]